jgi:glycosyltransferase involved in cell wall biosynthesis
MQFSVIIPTYNRVKLLRATLDSVLAQVRTDFEVIVVDDGSTDGTMEYLNSLSNRLRALQQHNAGPGSARNAGAAIAQGKYLAFLDSDDLWFSWTLATYEVVIRQHGSPAFIAGKPFRFGEETELSGTKSLPVKTNSFPDYLASGSEWRWWGASSFVVRRDAFEAAGKFTDEWVNGEDADLVMRLGAAPGFVQITDPPTFAYRAHGSNAMKNFSKTLTGTWFGVRAEKAGEYPGGAARAQERRRILTEHARPVTLECLQQGLCKDAWQLYWALFYWHLGLFRWKYLMGFPWKALTGKGK